jgi:uncharacterized protein (UPF0332 family)
MRREKHWNACANRLYYACFYAVTAVLAKEELASSKHSGVKALFNKHLVKTRQVSKEDGRLYNQLFEARQEGDYVDFVVFDAAAVEPWISRASHFIEALSILAKNNP